MATLFIDIASKQALIALVTADAVLASRTSDERVGDAELIPMVEGVLKDADSSYEDVDRIACVTGPGGFTSLRVGITFANVLADQLDIPVAGVHLSDLCYARIENVDSGIWIHSTKKTEVFVRGFGALEKQWPEPTHLSVDDLLSALPDGTMWFGELIEDHQNALGDKNCIEESLQPATQVLPAFLETKEYKTDQLEPWYGRGY